jgi:phage-related minor tail protein
MSGDLVAKLRLEATGGAQASAEVAKVEQSLKTVAPAANEAAAGVNRAGAASSAASSQLGGNVVTLNRHAAASRLSAAESLNLSRQLTDVAVSAAGGINPMMILIQQGPQIADVFAMAGARGVSFSQALGGVAGQALGLVARAGPFALLAGAVGLVVTGFLKGEAEAARFQNTLTATGNAAGVTAGQYEAMAHRIASATGESVSTSKAALTQLIATGQFSAKTIEDLTVAAERYAQLTGQSTQEIL